MVRCLASASRQKTMRGILESGTHSSVTGNLFNETVNVSKRTANTDRTLEPNYYPLITVEK